MVYQPKHIVLPYQLSFLFFMKASGKLGMIPEDDLSSTEYKKARINEEIKESIKEY